MHILAIIYYICIGTHKVTTSSEQIYIKFTIKYNTMGEIKFTEFWKSLDLIQKNQLRVLLCQKVECSPATVDKYGVGYRTPSPYKKVKICNLVRKHFNKNITF